MSIRYQGLLWEKSVLPLGVGNGFGGDLVQLTYVIAGEEAPEAKVLSDIFRTQIPAIQFVNPGFYSIL